MKALKSGKLINRFANMTRYDSIERLVAECDNLQSLTKNESVIPKQIGKTFEQFISDANEHTTKQMPVDNRKYLKRIYLASRSLDFKRFLIFLGNSIK